MHIHTVIVSYKRKELTEKTLRGYLDTVSVPHSLVIVDNGSPSNVTDWLASLDVPVMFLEANYFPGYATNRGWERMPSETTLLHRLDNDTLLLPGWCENAVECFEDPNVGQYGLLGDGDLEWLHAHAIYASGKNGWPVGGNSIIRRELYDHGLRYSEKPWTAGGMLEDSQLTLDVWRMGYERVFSTTPVMEYLGGRYPDYDVEIKKSRGL
jgi:GT2 family glycosyltransferase